MLPKREANREKYLLVTVNGCNQTQKQITSSFKSMKSLKIEKYRNYYLLPAYRNQYEVD